MKSLTLLGSTGSIGTQTLDIVRNNPKDFKIVGLSCGHNIELLKKQIIEFKPVMVCVSEKNDADSLAKEFNDVSFVYGLEGLNTISGQKESTMLVNALMGMVGFMPTYTALCCGKDVALANKETLVAGGELIMKAAIEHNVRIYPVDSEHSAIFQCLEAAGPNTIKKILLTASGGPFRGKTKRDLENVTKEAALKHPNWSMGNKITIDSATLMNKGLEVIEAAILFGVDASDVTVVVHPQSAIHSAVQFADGAIIAQLGIPDMKIPIAYALTYPNRLDGVAKELDLFELKSMSFEAPDLETFECLKLAYYALSKGQSYRIVLNAANEVAVAAFLKDEIKFLDIAQVVRQSLEEHHACVIETPDDVIRLDRESRDYANRIIKVLGEK